MPDWETPTLGPAIVRFPLRASELGFELMAQDALLPETDTEAQLNPELAVAGAQSTGLVLPGTVPSNPSGRSRSMDPSDVPILSRVTGNTGSEVIE